MQQALVPLRPINRRQKNNFIVLTHIGNCSLKLNPMDPDMEGFLPYYTYNSHQDYFFENLEQRQFPFHFLSNQVMRDWVTINASPLNMASPIIANAIENGYVDHYFQDAILIAIQDDYSLRVPDLRTFETLGARVIAPLLQTLRMGNYRDSVLWFDEIFNLEKYQADLEADYHGNKYKYKVKPMKYFDRVQFNLEVRRFT